jgi:hypothetical protein
MLRLSSRRAVVAVSAGAAVLALGAAALPAQAAAIPGWRISATFSVHSKESFLASVAAVSARDAWSAGPTFSSNSDTFGSIIRHWNGRSWGAVTLPAKVARAWSQSLPIEPVVGASSTSDVWVFGGQTTGAYLRLNGSRWSLGHLPGTAPAAQNFVQINAVRVFSRSNVWAFGETDDESSPQLTVTPYAAHFNGARWSVTKVPGNSAITSVSAISAASIWAVAGSASPNLASPQQAAGKQVVLHWGPKGGWQEPAQPVLAAGSDLSAVLVESGNVVVGASEPNGAKGRTPQTTTWNGKAWSRPSVGGASSAKWQVVGLASDGRGGIWALGNATNRTSAKLWHLTGGKWTAVQPAFGRHAWQLLQLASVPHTESVWGAGALKVGKSAVALLAVAGPTPR